jgi:putative membrane protein
MAERSSNGPSDYLAAERTFLAWIRTGLALMGFGFVVARFGLFLQALRMGQPNGLGQPNALGQAGGLPQTAFATHAYGSSFWLGTALIAVGVIVNVVSARNHVRLVRELNRGGTGYARPSSLAIAVAVTLAGMGLAMAIYLVAVR